MNEHLALGRTADGTVVFCDPSDRDIELIAALRDEIDRTDPVPQKTIADAYDLADLTGHVRIPQYSAFVKELLGATDTEQEDQP